LRHPTAVDRAGHGKIVVAVDDLLVAGVFGALLEQLN